MAYASDRPPVQLEGEDHDRARGALQDLDSICHSLAELVLDRVYGKDRDRSRRLVQARVIFDNTKVIVGDGQVCGVYEDPPGRCRECNALEAAASVPSQ